MPRSRRKRVAAAASAAKGARKHDNDCDDKSADRHNNNNNNSDDQEDSDPKANAIAASPNPRTRTTTTTSTTTTAKRPRIDPTTTKDARTKTTTNSNVPPPPPSLFKMSSSLLLPCSSPLPLLLEHKDDDDNNDNNRNNKKTKSLSFSTTTNQSSHQTVILDQYPNLLADLLSFPADYYSSERNHVNHQNNSNHNNNNNSTNDDIVQDFLRTKFRQQAYHVPAVSAMPTGTSRRSNHHNNNKNKDKDNRSSQITHHHHHHHHHPRMARIVEKLFDLDVEQLLEHTASENIFVWLHEQEARPKQDAPESEKPQSSSPATRATSSFPSNTAPFSSSLIRSIEVSDCETALALYRAGHSLYCRAPTELEELLVPSLLENTGLGCGQYFYSSSSSSTSLSLPSSAEHGNDHDDDSHEPIQSPTHRRPHRPPVVTTTSSSSCLGRGEIELFVSAQAGLVTEWHYDFQENFTLQLSGRKQWTLQHSTVQSVLPRAVTPHYQSESVVEGQLLAARLASTFHGHDDDNDSSNKNERKDKDRNNSGLFQFGPPNTNHSNARGDTQEVIMEPGDVLYFPAGMWHKVKVLEPGVSLNISLMAMNYASLACQALEHYLLQRNAQWRQTILTRHYHPPARAPFVGVDNTDTNGANHHGEENADADAGPSRQRKHAPSKKGDTSTSETREADPPAPTSAVDQLQYLLEHDLPQALQDLVQKHGGAAAILPPTLRQGQLHPQLHCSSENKLVNGKEDDGDHSHVDDDDDDEEEEESDSAKLKCRTDDSVDLLPAGGDDSEEEGESIIDIEKHPPPTTIGFDPSPDALNEKLKSHRLIRNPLAMLIRQHDISRFYQGRNNVHHNRRKEVKEEGNNKDIIDDNDDDDDDDDQGTLFVLNFNFAGSELSRESFVRATLRSKTETTRTTAPEGSHSALLDTLFLTETNADRQSSALIQSSEDRKCNTIAWLVYLGYLVWVERKL